MLCRHPSLLLSVLSFSEASLAIADALRRGQFLIAASAGGDGEIFNLRNATEFLRSSIVVRAEERSGVARAHGDPRHHDRPPPDATMPRQRHGSVRINHAVMSGPASSNFPSTMFVGADAAIRSRQELESGWGRNWAAITTSAGNAVLFIARAEVASSTPASHGLRRGLWRRQAS
jgi:hypothetical protein